MKKIGTITFHNAHNYGAMLQAYALQQKLSEKNYNVRIVNYENNNITEDYNIELKFCKNPIKDIKLLIKHILFYKKRKARYEKFELFMKKKMLLSEQVNVNEIKSNKLECDTYITGSDQVWNTDITKKLDDIYTLNFGDETLNKISYAASFGNSYIDEDKKEIYKEKLSSINSISVREETGESIIHEILPSKKVTTVLDPTLLLTKEEWEKEIEGIKEEKERYILTYTKSENKEYIKIVNYLSKITGYKIIYFENINRYKRALKSAFTYDPLEFVNLIKNAEYIVATSFHATVFSIIFNKKFWIVPHKKTGSRVTDLLKKLGISNRAIKTLEEFKERKYDEDINYNEVNKILEKEREKSVNWLIDAIENKKK